MLRQEHDCPTGRAIRDMIPLDAIRLRDNMVIESPAHVSGLKLPSVIQKIRMISYLTTLFLISIGKQMTTIKTLKNSVVVCSDDIVPPTPYLVDAGRKLLLKVCLHYPVTVLITLTAITVVQNLFQI